MKKINQLLAFVILILINTNLTNAQWYQQNSGTSKNLNGVSFTDANNGTAVGGDYILGGASNSIILLTTNGGSTWITQSTGTAYCLFGVSFADVYNGTAVGNNGTILRTTNSGATWTSQSSGTTNWLYNVFFTGANDGTVVGANGTILRTTDGGMTWTSQLSGTSVFLCGVIFINENIGTVVGQNGVILRTTNGGENWFWQSSGTSLSLYGVSFTDSDNGMVVGGFYDFEGTGTWWSIILKTTNGGTTWTTQSTGSEYLLEEVDLTDENNGTAVGWGYKGGIILRTTDAGTTWIEQLRTSNGLFGVSFTDANNGTVVGAIGTFLRTTNGGVTFIDEDKNEFTPDCFILSQNYPNPFNPSTLIKYSIPTAEFVTLRVYDILGNEVATLVDEEKSTGSYEVQFDASELSSGISARGGYASGIYFYKLQAGNFVETRKMILMK